MSGHVHPDELSEFECHQLDVRHDRDRCVYCADERARAGQRAEVYSLKAQLSESRDEVTKLRATAMELREALLKLGFASPNAADLRLIIASSGPTFDELRQFDSMLAALDSARTMAHEALSGSAYLMANTKETER